MAEKNPADDAAARINGNDHFRAKSVERAADDSALRQIFCLRKIHATE